MANMRKTCPLYLAQSLRDLDKCTNHTYGRRLDLLYRASDTLAQNVFDINMQVPVDEEKLYVLCVRYGKLVNTIRIQVQDERFFSMRFASTLKKIEDLKASTSKSLTCRYEEHILPISLDAKLAPFSSNGTMEEEEGKSGIIKDNDVFISSHQLYALLNDKSTKLLILDARPSSEFNEAGLKFSYTINIPEEIIHKGLSTNTLQQKLEPPTAAIFNTRHDFDFIVLADLDTNKISYNSTKLHDLRTILIDWDIDQRYQTLPLILDGGIRCMSDDYPTLIKNPGVIFNQLFHQFDDLMQDDIEYPDVPIADAPDPIPTFPYSSSDEDTPEEVVPSSTKTSATSSSEKESSLTIVTQRLLSLCEHQVLVEEKMLKIVQKRLDIKRKHISRAINIQDARAQIAEMNRNISHADSQRVQLEKRVKIARKEFEARRTREDDTSYLDYMFKDIATLERKRLAKYQSRKILEQEELDIDRNIPIKDPARESRVPIPDRSTKPSGSNTIEMEIGKMISNYPSSGITGLVNIKNTCYMNSLVQCLRFCPTVAFFMTMRTFNASHSLINSLSELMKKLWAENHVAIRPHNFYNEACKFADHDYSTGEHEDIHEFFGSVTDALHKELARPLETSGECTTHLSDWHKAFKSKISFINRTFFYQLQVTTSCQRCSTCIVKYEYNNNVFLTMDTVAGKAMNVQKEVDVVMNPSRDKDAQKYCSKCELQMNVAHQVTFYPKVLVVNLMRYTYSIKDQCVLRLLNEAHFPLELIFAGVKYNLCAIACHSGNRDRGHYTACCYHPSLKRWFEYNDETCTMTRVMDAAYRVRAYMLFYTIAPEHDGINRYFFQ